MRYDRNRLKTAPHRPTKLWSLSRRIEWSIVSNATLRLSNTKTASFLISKESDKVLFWDFRLSPLDIICTHVYHHCVLRGWVSSKPGNLEEMSLTVELWTWLSGSAECSPHRVSDATYCYTVCHFYGTALAQKWTQCGNEASVGWAPGRFPRCFGCLMVKIHRKSSEVQCKIVL